MELTGAEILVESLKSAGGSAVPSPIWWGWPKPASAEERQDRAHRRRWNGELCAVLHNGVFGNMRAVQIKQLQGRSIGTELPIPNLTAIVCEFGAYAERVEEPAQIIPAVHRALASGKPALLEFMVDCSAQNLVPPKLPS